MHICIYDVVYSIMHCDVACIDSMGDLMVSNDLIHLYPFHFNRYSFGEVWWIPVVPTVVPAMPRGFEWFDMSFGQGRPLLWAGARFCQPLPIAVHGMSMLQAALEMHHCGFSVPSCRLRTSNKYEKHGAFLICRKIEQNFRIPLELYHFSKSRISSQVQAKKVNQANTQGRTKASFHWKPHADATHLLSNEAARQPCKSLRSPNSVRQTPSAHSWSQGVRIHRKQRKLKTLQNLSHTSCSI